MESRCASYGLNKIMNRYQIKKATLSAVVVWILGATAYVLSFFVPVLEDPEVQADWVLAFALIPATIFGARLYYKNGFDTSGLKVGCYMFLITILMDAGITVPAFILPNGGDYIGFFGDPIFWLIGFEYILLVMLYSWIKKSVIFARITND